MGWGTKGPKQIRLETFSLFLVKLPPSGEVAPLGDERGAVISKGIGLITASVSEVAWCFQAQAGRMVLFSRFTILYFSEHSLLSEKDFSYI